MENPFVPDPSLPVLIQGGMGIGVSHWQLARAVALTGQLGVVSGTALNTLLCRRLQDGDSSGDLRRALAACPLRAAVERVLARYFVPGGLPTGAPYRLTPLYSLETPRELIEITIVASFAEVFLAKEGHAGPVGINLLEKIQLPTLPTLYGAMLADVDYVLMGAGIPRAIPGLLDALAAGRAAELRIDVIERSGTAAEPRPPAILRLDPNELGLAIPGTLRRPRFLAIVSAAAVALTLARKASGRVDGFVVEGANAGGHNAPPRGGSTDERGQPIYGPRDKVDLEAIRSLGRPFWLAGGFAGAEKLREAQALGAQGVQLGTAFAFCEESGVTPDLRARILAKSLAGSLEVLTDLRASPTGLPFKVVGVPGSLSEPAVHAMRERRCDLGYLRQPYRREDGSVGYRCPAEPVEDYVRKGGDPADAMGRKCLCNGLLATAGLGQRLHDGDREAPIVTGGADIAKLAALLPPGQLDYAAGDVLRQLGLPDTPQKPGSSSIS